MRYRPEIDGLRAVAVVPVILYHAGFAPFSGGYVGVDVFFVISGYLITSLIVQDLAAGRFSLARFYDRRARRILPALFVVLAATMPAAWAWYTPEMMQGYARALVSVLLFASNFQFWSEAGYFDISAELKPLLHTWSLAVEEQFYLIFPLLMLMARQWSRRRLGWLFATMALASLLLAQWSQARFPAFAFYLLPSRGWELLVGALAALWLARAPGPIHRGAAEVAGLAGLAMILAPVFLYSRATPFPGITAAVPALGSLLVILFAGHNTLAGRLLSLRGFVGIGLISYSAYLWHQPIYAFKTYLKPEGIGFWWLVALTLLVLPLAWFSWRFVERPFRQPGRIGTRAMLRGFVGAALVIAAFGGTAIWRQGALPLADLERIGRDRERAELRLQRSVDIGSGVCHYTQRGENWRIGDFLAQWDCRPAPGAEEPAPWMVFGDSHAADKAMALRLGGLDPVQITGANCPLIPAHLRRADPNCGELLELARDQGEIRGVLLARRFPGGNITPERLRQIVEYWSPRAPQVVLFSPMPDFSVALAEYLRTGRAVSSPDFSLSDRFFQAVGTIDLPANVTIIDTARLLCGAGRAACPLRDRQGRLLMVDGGHLSPPGAGRLSGRLLRALENLPAAP